jgi:hypothetical protein
MLLKDRPSRLGRMGRPKQILEMAGTQPAAWPAAEYLCYSQGCTVLTRNYLAVLFFVNSVTWLDKFCIPGTKFSILVVAVYTLCSPAL